MREILFRGKTNKTGEWVYGGIFRSDIIESNGRMAGVLPETIGQYTGLKDKDGNRIFEDDILNVEYNYIGDTVVKFINGRFNIESYNLEKCVLNGNIHEKK